MGENASEIENKAASFAKMLNEARHASTRHAAAATCHSRRRRRRRAAATWRRALWLSPDRAILSESLTRGRCGRSACLQAKERLSSDIGLLGETLTTKADSHWLNDLETRIRAEVETLRKTGAQTVSKSALDAKLAVRCIPVTKGYSSTGLAYGIR